MKGSKNLKDIDKKISALDPRFREKIESLFSAMNESISMLYDAAIRDEKTGLYNSKFFDTILEMELEKADRGQQKLAVFVIDIDFFKKINDTYGHLEADEILVKLANILKKQFRKSDVVCRFGGEEFFVLLPETTLEKAKKITSRLRTRIKSDPFLKKYKLTVSGGLTQYKKGDTLKKIKERADKALYKAKNTGRDKFVVID